MVTNHRPTARPADLEGRGGRHGPARIAMLLLACLGVSTFATGCRPDRSDLETIDPNVGNAIAVNKAVQTVDPWPRTAFKNWQRTNGERVRKAYDRYEGVKAAAKKPAKSK